MLGVGIAVFGRGLIEGKVAAFLERPDFLGSGDAAEVVFAGHRDAGAFEHHDEKDGPISMMDNKRLDMGIEQDSSRTVQERLRNYFQKYLPLSLEITPGEFAALDGKPGHQ